MLHAFRIYVWADRTPKQRPERRPSVPRKGTAHWNNIGTTARGSALKLIFKARAANGAPVDCARNS
eukprot:7257735-Alexandrium_andersonii.AAC.1